MKNSQARPRRESAHNIVVIQKKITFVTQLRLAHIQQMQSDMLDLQRRIQKEWKQLRKEVLEGMPVEGGPIRAFIRQSGRKKTLVVK